jgi:very-short-patch-repair endonuclease
LTGLPEPQVNVIVRIANGKWRWRFDLCYPEYKLIIEYDGRQHAYDAAQWSRDLERREWLDQDGWRLLVVISDGIYPDPLRTVQRVRSALEERGAHVPKFFKQEWTRHFMARS